MNKMLNNKVICHVPLAISIQEANYLKYSIYRVIIIGIGLESVNGTTGNYVSRKRRMH